MKIAEFNLKEGIYHFNLDAVLTEFHAHPAAEIIISEAGKLTIETPGGKYSDLTAAVIPPNLPHRVRADTAKTEIIMLECGRQFLHRHGFVFKKEIITEIPAAADRQNLIRACRAASFPLTQEVRIEQCLAYINENTVAYENLLADLTEITHLSAGRLSHLFKQEAGISVKKYFVWNKLKRAFDLVLRDNKSMYEAALTSDFYDQAHLSKAFKQMLGITPSAVYNSRMLQI